MSIDLVRPHDMAHDQKGVATASLLVMALLDLSYRICAFGHLWLLVQET